MKTTKATVSAILYTSKTLANGEHPIMVRVCYNGKRKYKATGLSCSKTYWSTAKHEVKDRHTLAINMNTIINFEVSKLKDLVLDYERQGKPYSAQTLIDESSKKLPSRKTLYDIFEERITYFRNTTKKYNTATGYKTLLNIIKRYMNDKSLELFDIDSEWLSGFETYLSANYADTSIKKFWDTFRALMNYSVKAKLIDKTPFSEFIPRKLDTRTKKRALSIDEIMVLLRYYVKTYINNKDKPNLETTKKHYWHSRHFKRRGENKLTNIDAEQFALSMFLCSYMMQGLALIDMARLKWRDMVDLEILNTEKYNKDIIEYNIDYAEVHKEMDDYIEINIVRAKTQQPTQIIIKMDLLWAWLMKPYLPKRPQTYDDVADEYIFPIFLDNDPEHQFGRMTYATYLINHNLKRIAERVGLSQSITFYSARHSYASMLYHADVSLSLIAQNMGRDVKDIETYLKGFDKERIIEANKQIWITNQKGFIKAQ